MSSAFSGRSFFLAAPMRHSISQLKPPQVLYHLLLVVAIFSLPHPCAIRFPRSNRQISTNPISYAFSGRYFSLAAPMCNWISQVKSSNPHKSYHLLLVVAIFPFPCAIAFPRSNRPISTNPISSAFSGRYFSLPMCHCISQSKSSNLHKSYLICF